MEGKETEWREIDKTTFGSLCVLDKKKTTMSLTQLSTDTPAKLLTMFGE